MGKRIRNKNRSLTQEEIWDDTALIESWDDALNEYRIYHSIHAKGEDIDEVIRQAETTETSSTTLESKLSVSPDGLYTGRDTKVGVRPEPDERPAVSLDASASETPPIGQLEARSYPADSQTASSSATTNFPGALTSTLRDEGLQDLMTAWYYAGYYTGFHEGQQQADHRINK